MESPCRRWPRLTGDAGGLSIEAALGIGAILAVFTLLIQATAVGVEYVRMLDVTVETAELASASGRLSLRMAQARQWAQERLPAVQFELSADFRTVRVAASRQVVVLGGIWRPQLRVSADAVLIDQAAW